MARGLFFVPFFLLLLSGCAAISERLGIANEEVPQPTAETRQPVAPADEKQPEPVLSNSSPSPKPNSNNSGAADNSADHNLSREQIQQAQKLLKTSGFNPGPVDGILGPKTRAAVQDFRSGCVKLSRLVETSDEQALQQTAAAKPTGADSPRKRGPGTEQVRQAQKVLKTSAFNPGAIDGILGPKTRAAVQDFRSGCVKLNKLLETPAEKLSQQTAKAPSHATPAPEKQSQVAVPGSPLSLERGKEEVGKSITLVNQNLGNEEIRLVQKRLKASGFYPGPVDGILGPKTRAALQRELRAKYEY